MEGITREVLRGAHLGSDSLACPGRVIRWGVQLEMVLRLPLYQQRGDVIGILARAAALFSPEITDRGDTYHRANERAASGKRV